MSRIGLVVVVCSVMGMDNVNVLAILEGTVFQTRSLGNHYKYSILVVVYYDCFARVLSHREWHIISADSSNESNSYNCIVIIVGN